jgi:hypothetical protein
VSLPVAPTIGDYGGAWAQGRASDDDCLRVNKCPIHRHFCASLLSVAAGCDGAQNALNGVTNDVLYQLSYCGINDFTKCRAVSYATGATRPGRPQYSKPRQ